MIVPSGAIFSKALVRQHPNVLSVYGMSGVLVATHEHDMN
jgi:hypothetical protein